MKKEILLVLGAAVLSVLIGFAVPNAFGGKATGIEVDKVLQKKNAEKQFKEELLRLYSEDQLNKLKELLKQDMARIEERIAALPKDEAQKIRNDMNEDVKRIIASAENQFEKLKAIELDEVPAGAAVPVEGAPDTTEAELLKSPDVKDTSIQSKIDAHRSEISDEDLNTGKVLYNELDTAFLSGLMEDGLTPEEDAQMQAYLKSVFTGGEYETAKELYYKYVHLLNE